MSKNENKKNELDKLHKLCVNISDILINQLIQEGGCTLEELVKEKSLNIAEDQKQKQKQVVNKSYVNMNDLFANEDNPEDMSEMVYVMKDNMLAQYGQTHTQKIQGHTIPSLTITGKITEEMDAENM